MKYRAGYKYQVHEDETVQVNIYPVADIDTKFISLSADGLLTIKAGYAFDGPSGPTVDTLNFMRGSLVHDALYQLMREKHISSFKNRKRADKILRDICREDGMSSIRAWWVYRGVRLGGKKSSITGRPVLEAPKRKT